MHEDDMRVDMPSVSASSTALRSRVPATSGNIDIRRRPNACERQCPIWQPSSRSRKQPDSKHPRQKRHDRCAWLKRHRETSWLSSGLRASVSNRSAFRRSHPWSQGSTRRRPPLHPGVAEETRFQQEPTPSSGAPESTHLTDPSHLATPCRPEPAGWSTWLHRRLATHSRPLTAHQLQVP